MKEESLADDMRAALRGDRERAEQARQRSTENVRALVDAVEPPPVPRRTEGQPERRFLGRFRRR